MSGFRCITARRHTITGEWIELVPPVEMHDEDIEAWLRSWEPVDETDYKLRLAGL